MSNLRFMSNNTLAADKVLYKGHAIVAVAATSVHVAEEVFTAAVHQGYIEPHSATALWNRDGHLTIWSSSQGHFTVQEQTALLLGVPVSKVKAIPMEIGGGFGGKLVVYLEPIAAALAKKAGRPVHDLLTAYED